MTTTKKERNDQVQLGICYSTHEMEPKRQTEVEGTINGHCPNDREIVYRLFFFVWRIGSPRREFANALSGSVGSFDYRRADSGPKRLRPSFTSALLSNFND